MEILKTAIGFLVIIGAIVVKVKQSQYLIDKKLKEAKK